MAAQSHRSNGPGGPYDGGTAGIQSRRGLPRGTRAEMTSSKTNNARPRGSWIKILLFPLVVLLLSAVPAQAQSTVNCPSQSGPVIDGFVNPVPPVNVQIDGNCTFRNFPASNPLTTNIQFFGNKNTSWLVIFD